MQSELFKYLISILFYAALRTKTHVTWKESSHYAIPALLYALRLADLSILLRILYIYICSNNIGYVVIQKLNSPITAQVTMTMDIDVVLICL